MEPIFFISLLVISIPIIMIGLIFLVTYILRKIFKPNEEYLRDFSKLKYTKIRNILFLILVLISSISSKFSSILPYGFIIIFTIDLFCNLNYLKYKNDSKSTKLFLLTQYSLGLVFLLLLASMFR